MRITIFGDTMCSSDYLEHFSVFSVDEFFKSFEGVKEIISASDYTLLNLETPVAGAEMGVSDKQYSFNAPVDYALAVKKAGVNMVMCANNHILDRGVKGLKATAENLGKTGLEYIGIHVKHEPSYKIVEFVGVKVGFVNFTYGTNAFVNNNYLKNNERYMVDMLQRQELHNILTRKIRNGKSLYARGLRYIARRLGIGQIDVKPHVRRETAFFERRHFVKTIKECKRAGAEYIIVMPHVGGQYNDVPTDFTKEICNLAIKSGADVVIANHEHVVHPAEIKNGKLMFYSIGNFLGVNGVFREPYDKMSEYSVAVHIDLDRENEAKYSVSLYKTIVEDDIIKTVGVYDLIDNAKDAKTAESLKKDSLLLISRILGKEEKEIKKFYEINILQ